VFVVNTYMITHGVFSLSDKVKESIFELGAPMRQIPLLLMIVAM